jgi:CRP-like cAMP-binding protein
MNAKTRRCAPPTQGEALFADHQPLRVRYAKDELICRTGSYVAGIYVIASGLVDEIVQDPRLASGSEHHSLLGPGALIGLEILLDPREERHQTSCRALADTELLFIERNAFAATLDRDPEFRRFVESALAARHFALLRGLWRLISSPQDRIRSLLLDLTLHATSQDDNEAIALTREIDCRLLSQLTSLSLRQLRTACDQLEGIDVGRDGVIRYLPSLLLPQESRAGRL